MTKNELISSLELERIPEHWDEFYEEVASSYRARAGEILDSDYISGIIRENNVLCNYEEHVLRAAERIRKNEALALFVCLLERNLSSDGKATAQDITLPRGDGVEYDFLPLFAMLPSIPATVGDLHRRGVPEDMISATIQEYDDCVYVYSLHEGHPGFNLRFYRWTRLLFEKRLIRIGRLNFELLPEFRGKVRVFESDDGEYRMLADGMRVHRSGIALGSYGAEDENGSFFAEIEETDKEYAGHPIGSDGRVSSSIIELSKPYWQERLRPGDPVIAVHIPRRGDLSRENCERSYEMAREILRSCFPEFKYRAFSCISWMMDPQLEKLLKPSSNIVAFQKKFMRFTNESGAKAVFSFVFLRPFEQYEREIDYKSLAEDTSLEMAVKKQYLDGKCIYECGGVFF